jgi:hypothetical protein
MNIINKVYRDKCNRQAAPKGNVSISNNVKIESVEETS